MLLQVDGTPGEQAKGMAGLGMVARSVDGAVLQWHMTRAPAHTCNEAEYQAVIAGLRWIRAAFPTACVACLTDSRIVADQVTGRAAVRAAALVPLHRTVVALLRNGPPTTVIALPRALNRLADALAWEALDGQSPIARIGYEALVRLQKGESHDNH